MHCLWNILSNLVIFSGTSKIVVALFNTFYYIFNTDFLSQSVQNVWVAHLHLYIGLLKMQ